MDKKIEIVKSFLSMREGFGKIFIKSDKLKFSICKCCGTSITRYIKTVALVYSKDEEEINNLK